MRCLSYLSGKVLCYRHHTTQPINKMNDPLSSEQNPRESPNNRFWGGNIFGVLTSLKTAVVKTIEI